MKEILETVLTRLNTDDTLKTLLGYTESNKNIVSFESLKTYDFDKMLLFGKLTANKLDEETTISEVREYEMQTQGLDKVNNISVMDINERVLALLHLYKLEKTDVMRSLKCEWERSLTVFYDNEIKMYVGTMYFSLIITRLD